MTKCETLIIIVFISGVVVCGEGEIICFENLACYNQTSPWVSLRRPIPQPQSPEEIGIGFYLLTR